MGNEQGKLIDTTTPEGIRAMDENLQKKFSKGIQYNMKVVVRGDRNTGKSCLLYRMQGRSFTEAYLPTNEIQVGHILWTYPGTNDTVKVEIWDTVDKGKPQQKSASKGLKLFNKKEEEDPADPVLDAGFLDVYKGAHAVVLLYDIVKQWTWQYVERQIVNVPYHIPILVLGNFSDMEEHRSKSYEDAEFYVTHLNRPEGAADIRYAECSMKNGFGLRYLHKFLSIPFLQMQQESLLHQLKSNREQILVIQEELDGYQCSTSYEQFQKQMTSKPAEQPPSSSLKPPEANNTHSAAAQKSSPVIDPSKGFESTDGSTPESTNEVQPVGKKLSSRFSGFLSKNKDKDSLKQKKDAQSPKSFTAKSPSNRKSKVKNVDEFVPDGELDDQFFNDDEEGVAEEGGEGDGDTDDTDEDYNPQVAMDEDLSSDEQEESNTAGVMKLETKQEPDDDEEDEEEEEEEEDDDDEDVVEEPPVVTMIQPEILKPTVAKLSPPKPKKTVVVEKKPLKSMQDIVLTESEEDDEEEEEKSSTVRNGAIDEVKPKSSSSNKTEKKKSSKKESSGGLLLAFTETTPTKPRKKKPETETSESPSTEKRKKERRSSDGASKHKKHRKKSRHDKEEDKEAVVNEKSKPDEDPFGFSTSLDAWLGGSDESPIQPRSTHGLSKKITESIAEDDDDEEKPRKKRSKDGSKKKRRSKKDPGTFNELL